MICDVTTSSPCLTAADVPEWQRESSTIMGQVTFLILCVPACYLSDRSIQRGAASRFPAMAAAAALSSACSFVVLGDARDCTAGQLTVSRAPSVSMALSVSIFLTFCCAGAHVRVLGVFGVFYSGGACHHGTAPACWLGARYCAWLSCHLPHTRLTAYATCYNPRVL